VLSSVFRAALLTTLLLGLAVIPYLVFNWATGILHGPQIDYPFVALIAAILSGGWGVSIGFSRPGSPQ